jgi:drug/metabolite transporter (DMT)-like permease
MLLALSLVWGSTWIANEMLRNQCGPLRLAMLRYLLAAFFVACVLCVQQIYRRLRQGGQTSLSHDAFSDGSIQSRFTGPAEPDTHRTKDHGWIAVSALLGCTMFVVPGLLLVWSAGRVAGGWIPMIYAGLPLFLMLVAGELRTPAILGVGAMLILLNGSLPLTVGRLLWVLPIVGGVISQGWSLVYAQRHCAVASSLRGAMVQFMTAALLLWTATKLWPEAPGAESLLRWQASSLGVLSLIAGLATAVAYPLYYRLLQSLEPAQLAISEWLQTLVAISESAILLHVRPGWPMLGAAAVLVGCAVALLRGDSDQAESILRLTS